LAGVLTTQAAPCRLWVLPCREATSLTAQKACQTSGLTFSKAENKIKIAGSLKLPQKLMYVEN
jgi:hypothetical protein